MDGLYDRNKSENTIDTSIGVITKVPSESERYFQEFREYDYEIDIRDNIIYITDTIEHGLLTEFIGKVNLLQKINPDNRAITILLNSNGGDVIETLGMIDYMRMKRDTIGLVFNIVVRGTAMSAAALLLTAGTGVRAASKHSKIMVHELSTLKMGKISDVKAGAKFSEHLEQDCNRIMAECTTRDFDFWKNVQRVDYFLDSAEAMELGIIDKII